MARLHHDEADGAPQAAPGGKRDGAQRQRLRPQQGEERVEQEDADAPAAGRTVGCGEGAFARGHVSLVCFGRRATVFKLPWLPDTLHDLHMGSPDGKHGEVDGWEEGKRSPVVAQALHRPAVGEGWEGGPVGRGNIGKPCGMLHAHAKQKVQNNAVPGAVQRTHRIMKLTAEAPAKKKTMPLRAKLRVLCTTAAEGMGEVRRERAAFVGRAGA